MTLLVQQAPPAPPFDPNLIFMNEGGPPIVLFIVIAALVATVILLRPLIRAFARRMEGKGTDIALRAEIDQLHAKLSEVDALHERVAELEERLDFTERLLAQAHDAQSRVLPGESR
jgi:flagellar biosynthesis/type III secretory pathway M-ring protein FliF/YscJ